MDQAPASTTNHALEACERMLRPIMRLALDRGLKYQDIDELIRDLMLDEAARDWVKRNGKEPSGSQLSVTTGINRKEVKRRASSDESDKYGPNTQKSIVAQVFMTWSQSAKTSTALRRVPILSPDPNITSFATVAQSAVRDVHFRSVLDELIRLGLVIKRDGYVELATDSFVPKGADSDQLALMADNCCAHVNAALSNVSGGTPFLEQAIWGDGLSEHDCHQVHRIAREQWNSAQQALYNEFTKIPETVSSDSKHRIKIGMYVFHEKISEGAS
jgi:hypothetical protein